MNTKPLDGVRTSPRPIVESPASTAKTGGGDAAIDADVFIGGGTISSNDNENPAARVGLGQSVVQKSPEDLPTPQQTTERASAYLEARREAARNPNATQAWRDAHEVLLRDVQTWSAYAARFPVGHPEHVRARRALELIDALPRRADLQALADRDPTFAEVWNRYHDTRRSPGHALRKQMAHFGADWSDVELFMVTGNMTAELRDAMTKLHSRGDWLDYGMMHASFRLHAAYLRATGDEERASTVNDTARTFARTRRDAQLNYGRFRSAQAARLSAQPVTERSRRDQERIDRIRNQAEGAFDALISHYGTRLQGNPERFNADHPYRALVGNALYGKAGVTQQREGDEYQRAWASYRAELESAEATRNTFMTAALPLGAALPEVRLPSPPPVPEALDRGGRVEQLLSQAGDLDEAHQNLYRRTERQLLGSRIEMRTQQIRAADSSATPSPGTSAAIEARHRDRTELLDRASVRTRTLSGREPGTLTREERSELAEATTWIPRLSGDLARDEALLDDARLTEDATRALLGQAEDAVERLQASRASWRQRKSDRIRSAMEESPAAIYVITGIGYAPPEQIEEYHRWRGDPDAYVAAAENTEDEQRNLDIINDRLAGVTAQVDTARTALERATSATETAEHYDRQLRGERPTNRVEDARSLLESAASHFDTSAAPTENTAAFWADAVRFESNQVDMDLEVGQEAARALQRTSQRSIVLQRDIAQRLGALGPTSQRLTEIQRTTSERANELRDRVRFNPADGTARDPLTGEQYHVMGRSPFTRAGEGDPVVYLLTDTEWSVYQGLLSATVDARKPVLEARAELERLGAEADQALVDSHDAFVSARTNIGRADAARAAWIGSGGDDTNGARGFALNAIGLRTRAAVLGSTTDADDAFQLIREGRNILEQELPPASAETADLEADRTDTTHGQGLLLLTEGTIAFKNAADGPASRQRMWVNVDGQRPSSGEVGRVTGQAVLFARGLVGDLDAHGEQVASRNAELGDQLQQQADGSRERMAAWHTPVYGELGRAGDGRLSEDRERLGKQLARTRKMFKERTRGSVGVVAEVIGHGVSVFSDGIPGGSIRDAINESEGDAFDRVNSAANRAGDALGAGYDALIDIDSRTDESPDDVVRAYALAGALRDPRMHQTGTTRDAWLTEVAQLPYGWGPLGMDTANALAGLTNDPFIRAWQNTTSSDTSGITAQLQNLNNGVSLFDAQLRSLADHTQFFDEARTDIETGVVAWANAGMDIGGAIILTAPLAPVLAGASKITGLARAFGGARAIASGSSVATFGVNVGETAVGMAIGYGVERMATDVFHLERGSLGHFALTAIGNAWNFSTASRVAQQPNLVFQMGMGLTMSGVPMVARDLGMSPENAAILGQSIGIFVPALMGTIADRKTRHHIDAAMDSAGIPAAQRAELVRKVFVTEAMQGPVGVEDIQAIVGDAIPETTQRALVDAYNFDVAEASVPAPELTSNAPVRATIDRVADYYDRLQRTLVDDGMDATTARTLVSDERNAVFGAALDASEQSLTAAAVNQPPFRTGNQANPLSATTHEGPVRVIRRDWHDGTPRQREEHGLTLLSVNRETNVAEVVDRRGNISQVPATDLVYEHNGIAYGALKPDVQRAIEDKIQLLSEPQRIAYSEMLGEAHARSPEHAIALARLFAAEGDLEAVAEFKSRIMHLDQSEVGKLTSMAGLTQHPITGCVPTSMQFAVGSMHPELGRRITQSPRDAGYQQLAILERNQGYSALRADSSYAHSYAHGGVPALPPEFGSAARPMDIDKAPAELTTWSGKQGVSVYDAAADLDSRALWDQLARATSEGPVHVLLRGESGTTAARLYHNPWGFEYVLPGTGARIPESSLPNLTLTHVAVPDSMRLKPPNRGMDLTRDPYIQRDLATVTGSFYERRDLETSSTQTLDNVQDVLDRGSPVGLVIKWDGDGDYYHQLMAIDARIVDGQREIFVFDPTLDAGRWLTDDRILRYNDDITAEGVGGLVSIQVPERTAPTPGTQNQGARIVEHNDIAGLEYGRIFFGAEPMTRYMIGDAYHADGIVVTGQGRTEVWSLARVMDENPALLEGATVETPRGRGTIVLATPEDISVRLFNDTAESDFVYGLAREEIETSGLHLVRSEESPPPAASTAPSNRVGSIRAGLETAELTAFDAALTLVDAESHTRIFTTLSTMEPGRRLGVIRGLLRSNPAVQTRLLETWGKDE